MCIIVSDVVNTQHPQNQAFTKQWWGDSLIVYDVTRVYIAHARAICIARGVPWPCSMDVEKPEAKVFRKFKPLLVGAVKDSLLDVASECYSRRLINQVYDEIVQLPLTSKERTIRLLDAIEKYVATDSANYDTFMVILNEKLPRSCDSLLLDMSKALEDVRDSGETIHPCTDNMTEDSIVELPTPPTSGVKVSTPSKQQRLKDVTNVGPTLRHRAVSRTGSADSGVSLGRSDSSASDHDGALKRLDSVPGDLQPIQETPLQDKCSVQKKTESGNTCSSKLSDQLLSVQETINYLRCDAKQMEAVNTSQKEELKRLKDELNAAVSKRDEAVHTLRERERELAKLKEEREQEMAKLKEEREQEKDVLARKDDQIDGLKSRLSSCESSREKLRVEMRDCEVQHDKKIQEYERMIDDLGTKVRKLERIIKDLRHQLERKNGEAQLAYRLSDSTELQGEIDQHKAEAKEANDKLKRCKEQHSNELVFARRKERLYCFSILLLLVVVVALFLYFVYYKDSHCVSSAASS